MNHVVEEGWTKYFKDGNIEVGSDRLVRARAASWRHGRLKGLVAAGLRHGPLRVTLSADEGNWWQSDTMVSKFRGYGKAGETSYLVRRLEYQISEKDIGKFVSRIINGNLVVVKVSGELPLTMAGEAVKLASSHVGKWLYVSLDVQSNMVTISFHDERK